MSNGFRYESPINRLLSVTIPRFLDSQLEREHRERISDREFAYRSEQDQLNRQQKIEDQAKLERRYNEALLESEDDEQYERGASIIEDTRALYPSMDRQLQAFEAINLSNLHPDVATRLTSNIGGLKESVAGVKTKMKPFESIKTYTDLDRERIQSAFMQGKDGYNVADDIIRDKFSTPYIKVQASLIGQKLTGLYKSESEARQLLSVTSDEDQQKIIQSNIDNLQRQINTEEGNIHGLFGQDRPFDPNTYRTQWQTSLFNRFETEGLDLDKIGRDNLNKKYQSEVTAFLQEYVIGENASKYSKEEKDAAGIEVIDDIIAKEKASPPEPDPQFNYENLNKLDAQGTALALAATAYALKNPAKKVYDYMGKKTVQAAGAVKEVWNMPASDITKFLHNVALDTPGKPGAMMPKVEKLLNEINELSGERKTPKIKKELADLNSELDKQVKKVMKRFRQLKVSPALNDASLEKLIRNPNKWRLAKIKSLLSKPKALAPSMRKWGVFSASAKIGEALGDPTGGIATGIGLPAVAKKVINIYKKKGPKWFMSKLTPVVGNAISKRIVGGVASGAIGGPAVIAGTIGGTGLAIYDIYKFFESLNEGGSEEEAAAILRSAVQRDSTEAYGPPDSLSFMTPAR